MTESTPASTDVSFLRVAAISIASAAVGATATILTGAFVYFNKNKELDIQMVQISLSILSGEDTGKKSAPARKFALHMLENYTGVEIPRDDFDSWVDGGVLPSTVMDTRGTAYQMGYLKGLEGGIKDQRELEERGKRGAPAGRGPKWAELQERLRQILVEIEQLEKSSEPDK